ncbi:N-acyl-D-glucosamine 2-epimerase [Roseospira marina]|uniref:N-acyl-D-glucosamine 2-epimerase n=1 Tax=Roseospira marina TaxID=140057 RepID=A0A5M6I8G2_9PROT|nr:AGE family epimerase/isomerase [Roseospira marina]KAA5604095.1 N-acyl-D-glucosamine 2-epimerase [Roseospira marina]MBB4315806.1 mannose/cellobiose epimerase-like protein (N-acyl-D-glucosamine 2-epimerase family)/anti-anti-sigma regulatory factor [Roseospira marina]MBB5088955.1 mannose/cellobiose epimerase-like protein (N-acyl-D-glucosamine 2-epimerase family)/anti-anti-sigma regulatory factor [Roseospira marina]
MNSVDFTFSDLIAGYVTAYDSDTDSFSLKTSDDRAYTIGLTDNTFAEVIRNLGEGFNNATDQMRGMLVPGRFVFAYGVFYPDGPNGTVLFDAKHLVFAGRTENAYVFEQPAWWIRQIEQLGRFYVESEFGDGEIDYRDYRTQLTITGQKQKSGRQETDTMSRLVYGFASAFLLTGNDRFLEAAEKGVEYLRAHLRFVDAGEDIVYWYHAVDLQDDGTEQKVFASEFGDDYDALPCYEQIYALAGPVQTYRITGDPDIYDDARRTINLFNRFYKDHGPNGGYYSHIDPVTLDPHAECLGHNRARKNWNSVGDHAPAYLINLWLATGEQPFADFLEYTFDTICERFPDYDNSAFVQEKFHDDWSKDQTWGWQQNRAVVGHNLKIAWNLMRMQSLKRKDTYVALAETIAQTIPDHGCDRQRGGWYDVVERVLDPGQRFHRFAWHDRKAWWQQEQGILAYLILHGVLKTDDYLRFAREGAAFYNAFFLDVESGGVYFNVLANGEPYALGTERGKGSHSMAGYHSFELAYLASVYTNLLIRQEPMDFYFRPRPGGFKDGILRVQPDILPEGAVRITDVWIDGHEYDDFDAEALTVTLPEGHGAIKVRVRLTPTAVRFSADVLDVSGTTARIALNGTLTPHDLKYLDEAFQTATAEGARALTFDGRELSSICSEGLRYLVFRKQKAGPDFKIRIENVQPAVADAIRGAAFDQEITIA